MGKRADGKTDWTLPAALGVAAVILFPVLGKSGIWDPYELDAGDLARRIAIQAFGARGLELPGGASSMPTLTDLKMGELPFTSMALGFKVFGLHDWSGRLPLAIWALAGALALYAFLARLISPRAGVYGAIALVTMPLYFMQARTMLGDAVTMAALTIAFTGLGGALFDVGRARGIWAVVAAFGLLSGYLSRGILIGVAAPLFSIGATWLVLRVARTPATPRALEITDGIGALILVAGIVAGAIGFRAVLRANPDAPLARLLGVALLRKPPLESTFDLYVRQLGHALFPWSAFLPFAIGRLFVSPPTAEGDARERETAARIALLVGASVVWFAYALLAPHTGQIPFAGPALLAGVAAVAIYDLERGAEPSRALAVGCAILAFVLYRDMVLTPDKALSVFSVDKPTFPKSFEADAQRAMQLAAAAFAGLVALSWFEEQPKELGRISLSQRVADYGEALRALAATWNGNLLFSFVVVEAALVGLGAMLFFGKGLGWSAVDKLPKNFAELGLNAWWALPLIAAGSVPAMHLVRDGFRRLVHWSRLPRAAATLLAALVAGGVLSFWYYPALAQQLSPKEVFEAYARLHGHGEPLALVGVRSRTAAYYSGGEVESFADANRAFSWLTEHMDERRWLVVKADDLPKLNSLYRKQVKRNLPVLDGRSSQILLVSNQLGDHKNESWLTSIVLDEPPTPSHAVDALLEDQLAVLGWDITDRSGRAVADVVPQTKYRMRFYYKVLRPITGTWKAFIHIDGYQRRFNGDHAVLDGKYPMSLWQPDDIIVDDTEVQLEPNFTPGDYTVFFGFFAGETRFRVTSGPHQENRVVGGALRVR